VRQALAGHLPHVLAGLVPEMLRSGTASQVRDLLSQESLR
jgi:hypothetical protein